MGVAHSLIFVPYFASDGTKNGIDTTSADLDQTYFEALVNQTDRSLRIRPINTGKRMEEVKIVRAASKMKTYSSGSTYFIQSGEKTWEALLPLASYGLINFFNSARCEKVGVYVVTRDGALVGNGGTPNFLYPFRVQDQSLDCYEMPADDGKPSELMLRFTFDSTENDESINLIEESSMSYDVRLLEGLYDAYGVFSDITAGGWVVDIRTYFGTVLNPNRVEGMVDTDFDLTDRGTGAPVTIDSVTESTVSPGIYTFVISGAASGDKLKLSFVYAGYDSNRLEGQVIELP